MTVQIERRYTVEDYFSVEESSAIKHEFCEGQIFAMAGASLRHNRIAGNVFATLRAALAGTDCEVFAGDLRVRTPSGLYTYADAMVICGAVQLSPHDRLDTVTNPTLLVEVLSKSTAAYDRGEKFRHYQSLPSLREYLLIDQSTIQVESHVRDGAGVERQWRRREHSTITDLVRLQSLGISVGLADIYAGIAFSSPMA